MLNAKQMKYLEDFEFNPMAVGGPAFEKNRTAYLLVLSLELIALLSVCFITMARKIMNK